MKSSKNKNSKLNDFIINPNKSLWALAIPMMFGMMVQTIYSLVDMIFVGMVGSNSLTALAFNLPILFFGMGLVFGLGSGVTAVIAQYIGSNDLEKANNSAQQSIYMGLIIGFILTFVGLVFGKEILKFLGTPLNILPLAWNYFKIIVSAYVFIVMSIFFRSIFSGEGDMKTPMIVGGFGTILNIILDPIFIFYFNMGVEGAALATVVSQIFVSLIFTYLLLIKKYSFIKISLSLYKFSFKILLKIIKIGLPASFSMIIMSIGGASFNRILVEFSSDAVAAFQIGIRLDHVFLIPAISISTSVVTLVGMFYGAKKFNLVKQITFYAIRSTILIGIIIGFLFFIFSDNIVSVFSDNINIQKISSQYLRYFVFGYPFVAISMISGRAMQGLGKGIPMLILTLLRVLVISLAFSFFFVFFLNKSIEWVWISQVISVIFSSFIAWLWLKYVFKKKI
ncbi:MAG: hypothetical protein CMF98_00310 [Candidatus Marinimicrobia bacterium]|nr:hypothetical protein [Candidatus Neomarinimicrobiota bacterium]OUW51046.1 MAG: hypothetical protein CBD50_00225 [bacterium TMED190]